MWGKKYVMRKCHFKSISIFEEGFAESYTYVPSQAVAINFILYAKISSGMYCIESRYPSITADWAGFVSSLSFCFVCFSFVELIFAPLVLLLLHLPCLSLYFVSLTFHFVKVSITLVGPTCWHFQNFPIIVKYIKSLAIYSWTFWQFLILDPNKEFETDCSKFSILVLNYPSRWPFSQLCYSSGLMQQNVRKVE